MPSNVTVTDEGLRTKIADISLLSSLNQGKEMKKSELIQKIRKRNHGNHIVDSTSTRQGLIKRNLNPSKYNYSTVIVLERD